MKGWLDSQELNHLLHPRTDGPAIADPVVGDVFFVHHCCGVGAIVMDQRRRIFHELQPQPRILISNVAQVSGDFAGDLRVPSPRPRG